MNVGMLGFTLADDEHYERLRDAIYSYFRSRRELARREFESGRPREAGTLYAQAVVDTVAQCFAIANSLLLGLGEDKAGIEQLASDARELFERQLVMTVATSIATLGRASRVLQKGGRA